ncbi:hypothetical protein KY339_01460 [Candidatus Woesearchaeota archaeon]|nr:hypothetical protein [Candidatus Woesearchaeota archaeon]
MGTLNPEILDSMTYAMFVEEMKFRHKEPPQEDICLFKAATNEGDFSEAVDRIRMSSQDMELFFMGVMGSGDMVLNYMANIPFKLAFLFDKDDKPIANLGLRLCLFGDVNNSLDYYLNMLCVGDNERSDFLLTQNNDDLNYDELLKKIRLYQPDPQRVAKQGEDFMKKLGYTPGNLAIDEVFLDTDFRKMAVIEIIKYAQRMRYDWTEPYSWFFGENLKKLKEFALVGGADGLNLSNRIRAFKADFYNKFENVAEELIDAYGIKNLVIYISNIAEIESRISKDHNPRRVIHVLEPLAEKLNKLWFIYSKRRDTTNRVIEHK